MKRPDSEADDFFEGDDFFALVDKGAQNHYENAVLYDYEYRRRRADAKFYRELAGELADPKQAVLELACGSGRVTSALLRGGHTVIGCDLSLSMLRRAAARIAKMGKAHRERIQLVRADMRRFVVSGDVPLVIAAFNSFEHLYTRTDVEAALDCVRRSLAPGGLFAFDVQNPDLSWLTRSPKKRWAKTTFTHPETKQRTIYTTNHDYDPISQICLIRIYYRPTGPGPERVIHLSQRKFFPVELETLLWANKFRVIKRYGDFSGEPLSADSESQVVVCEPV